MGTRDNRTKLIQIRVTAQEKQTIKQLTQQSDVGLGNMSTFIRRQLLAQAQQAMTPRQPPPPPPPHS